MPRPKSIPWENRVSVFLAYRRNGRKVYPVAKRYGIARSTVNVIINEFKDMGFTDRPRAKLSTEWLSQMQEQHLRTVMSPRGEVSLYLGPSNGDEAAWQAAAENPLPVAEDFAWHLKGTKTEQAIREATGAARDFLSRGLEAWRELRLTIEQLCGLPECWYAGAPYTPEAYLLPELKHQLRDAFFDRTFQEQPPPQSWLEWDVPGYDPRILRLQGKNVATGDAADHQRIQQGVAEFLASGFREHQTRFVQIEQLRGDLMFMKGIVSETLKSIDESDVRQGICPACPFPEARPEPDRDTGNTNPRGKREQQHE